MARDASYQAVMARQNEIMKKSLGMDYEQFVSGPIAFDYEAMMSGTGYTLEKIREIQREVGVGETPLLELRNITELVRRNAKPGYGARILV